MHLRFRHIEPEPLLKGYIEKMWIFESSGKIALADLKLVVANGNPKLTLSYQNGVVAGMNGKTFSSRENDITITGVVDVPVILDVEDDRPTETIGIEFNPRSAYRFFHFNLQQIQNQICSVRELFGNEGVRLVEQIGNAFTRREKIILLQQFLLSELAGSNTDPIFEYCVAQIFKFNGMISVKQLEKKTGYSSRWLNMKFSEKLGISPKNLDSIVRFKECYHAFLSSEQNLLRTKNFYKYYYDQSHFIKDFKRFTGLPPAKLSRQTNDFGAGYYNI